MFLGSSQHNLDDKCRLTLPNKDRQAFGDNKVYATLGFDGNLALYPEKSFSSLASTYEALPEFDSSSRQLKRTFFSHSAIVDIDSHGRIQLSKNLLQAAGITKAVQLVGRGDHIEVWDPSVYEEKNKSAKEDYGCLAQQILAANR